MKISHYSKHIFCTILLLLSITISIYDVGAQENAKSTIKILDQTNVPDSIYFLNEANEKLYLDQFEEKTILLVFWATWCSSCAKEMVDLDRLQKDFRKLPFEVVPVSQDFQSIEIIKKYYKDYDIRYLPMFHDFKNQLFKAFAIVGVPTSILISVDGKMLVKFTGYINWYDDEVRSLIMSYIPGNHSSPKNSYISTPIKSKLNASKAK